MRRLLLRKGRALRERVSYFHRTAALGPQEWLIAFTSPIFNASGAWWFTQMWRGAELATGSRDALIQWAVLIAAARARSLLEGAAYLAAETPSLIELWDSFKKSGVRRSIISTASFVISITAVTAFQYASRIGQGKEQPPRILSTNVMTHVQKLAKRTTSIDVVDTYEWLCDAVHPSFGSGTMTLPPGGKTGQGRTSPSNMLVTPLSKIVSSPQRLEPIVAQKAADAVIFATDLLDQDLARVRWVLDDVGLTSDIAVSPQAPHPRWRMLQPARNVSKCPCGSGRKFKRCVHQWGQPGTP